MNNEWALSKLDEFIRLATPRPKGEQTNRYQTLTFGTDIELISSWVFVEKILESVYADWHRNHLPTINEEYGSKREAAMHARAKVQNAAEIESNLVQAGPILRADNFHPVIWNQAQVYWSGGFYRSAVQTCGTLIDIKLQAFTGRRDITGRDLVNQSFSTDDPQVGKPRIRVPEQENVESTRSLREGVQSLGLACFALVRNLSTHRVEEITEHEALEQLALFSLFLKKLDLCSLETIDQR